MDAADRPERDHGGMRCAARLPLSAARSRYTQSFRAIIASGQVEPLVLPPRSPNLNAYAERWVRSVKEECLCKVILFGERSLRRALSEYVEHFHAERNHQGKGNVLLFPRSANTRRDGHVQCRKRLGGLTIPQSIGGAWPHRGFPLLVGLRRPQKVRLSGTPLVAQDAARARSSVNPTRPHFLHFCRKNLALGRVVEFCHGPAIENVADCIPSEAGKLIRIAAPYRGFDTATER